MARIILDRLCCDKTTSGDSDEVHIHVKWEISNGTYSANRIPATLDGSIRLKPEDSGADCQHCIGPILLCDVALADDAVLQVLVIVWEGSRCPNDIAEQYFDNALQAALSGWMQGGLTGAFWGAWKSQLSDFLQDIFGNNDPIGVFSARITQGRAEWTPAASSARLVGSTLTSAEFRLSGDEDECDYVATLSLAP